MKLSKSLLLNFGDYPGIRSTCFLWVVTCTVAIDYIHYYTRLRLRLMNFSKTSSMCGVINGATSRGTITPHMEEYTCTCTCELASSPLRAFFFVDNHYLIVV